MSTRNRTRTRTRNSPPRICTIAGSDSGGGAGIQADLKTITSLCGYGLSVLTALTAQSTTGVSAIHAVPPEFVKNQLDTVAVDIRIDAFKLGMLHDREIIECVADGLEKWAVGRADGGRNVPVVLDPVMVSTSGSLLLSHSSISTLVTRLLPLSTVLTPNLPEAEQLLDHARVDATSSSAGTEADRAPASSSQPPKAKEEITTLRQMLHAARSLALLGPQAVLVKGGHRPMRRSDVDAALTAEVGTAQGAAEEEPSRKERVHVVRSDTRPVAEVLRVWRSSGAAARTREEKEEDYEQVVVDVLYERSAASAQNRPQAVSHPANGLDAHCDGQWIVFVKPRVASDATHGTGCTLSSALATYLGFGHSIADAASQGITYVQRAIASGLEEIGSGPGPLDHASGIIRPAVPVPTRHDPTPLCTSLITTSRTLWLRFTQHDFVRGISSLTLPRESFLWFLKQDYLFLRAYARVWALASSKADASWADTARFADAAGAMAKEAEMHVGLCARWGIERKTLEREQESAATIAYTRFVLDVGHARGLLDLLVATAPCLIGYGEVGRWLRAQAHAQSSRAEVGEKAELKRAYDEWIEGYAGDEFQETVRLGIEELERHAIQNPPSPSRLAELQRIWDAAVSLEIGMWDEAMRPELRRLVLGP